MAETPLIFSTHSLHPEVSQALAKLGTLKVASAPTPEAISAESVGANIIIVRAPIPAEIVTREQGLMAAVRHGAGLDMIPMEDCTKAGVMVTNVRGANAVTVAEHAIWSAMSLLRKNPMVTRDLHAGGWEHGRRHSATGREISGRTLGILGFGNIGTTLSNMAQNGFGMSVISHTRSPDKLPETVEAVSLPDLLKRSDILVLSCPLTEQTRGLIGKDAIRSMKQGAILVNVARGPVVDEDALIEALKSGHLGGASIDVFAQQPLPIDHPFMALGNVVLTPHMAGITEESMLRLGQKVTEITAQILAGETPDNLCNPEVLPAYKARFPAP
ncbi:NAD(P)-dependent oxidoreductase [Neptunicoccus cionae]|uniref:NAD(P)-dependent oxidoreductase n=1 Tax=Neptunicoccus cionae TaxID=2035344 RepID=UPI000C768E81|nr:NAD(P)-dependent oxidoreductase [Amylibacter cionae]PLS20805.1 dehydrogenase [Amylibacter cionae]